MDFFFSYGLWWYIKYGVVFKVLFDGVLSSRECLVNGLCKNCENKGFFSVFDNGKHCQHHSVDREWCLINRARVIIGATRKPQGKTRSMADRACFWQIVLRWFSMEPHSIEPGQFCKKIILRTILQIKIFRGSMEVLWP